MTEEFNQWWNSESLTDDNLYPQDSPAYWAWEGWQAGVRAEREACAKLCEMVEDYDLYFGSQYAFAIRERGAP
jgi:hypothetical protein